MIVDIITDVGDNHRYWFWLRGEGRTGWIVCIWAIGKRIVTGRKFLPSPDANWNIAINNSFGNDCLIYIQNRCSESIVREPSNLKVIRSSELIKSRLIRVYDIANTILYFCLLYTSDAADE